MKKNFIVIIITIVVFVGILILFGTKISDKNGVGESKKDEADMILVIGEPHVLFIQKVNNIHEPHFIELLETNTDEKTARLRFSSEPKQVVLKKGETKQVDLDNDGNTDIDVSVAKVEREHAKVRIKQRYRSVDYFKKIIAALETNAKKCTDDFYDLDFLGRVQKYTFDEDARAGGKGLAHVTTFGLDGKPVTEVTYVTPGGRVERLYIHHEDGSSEEYVDDDGNGYADRIIVTDPYGTITKTTKTKARLSIDLLNGLMSVADKYINLNEEPAGKYKDDEGRVLTPETLDGTEFSGRIRDFDPFGNVRRERGFDETNMWNEKFFDEDGEITDNEFDGPLESNIQGRKTGIKIEFIKLLDRFDPDRNGQLDKGAVVDMRFWCRPDNQPPYVLFDGLGEFTAAGPVHLRTINNGKHAIVFGDSSAVYNGLLWRVPSGYDVVEVDAFNYPPPGGARRGYPGNIILEYSKNGENFGDQHNITTYSLSAGTDIFIAPAELTGVNLLFGKDGTAYQVIRLRRQ